MRRLFSLPLRIKILAPVAVILVVSSLLVSSVVLQILDNQLEEAGRNNAVELSKATVRALRQAMLSGQNEQITAVINDIGQTGGMPRLALRRPDGSYLAEPRGETYSAKVKPLTPRPGKPEFQKITGSGGEQRLRVVTAIANQKECFGCHSSTRPVLGYLEADVSLGWVSEHTSYSRQLITLVTVVSILAVWLAIWAATHLAVISPLRSLASAMLGIQRGERRVEIPTANRDEIGQLTERFNAMVKDIAKAEADLLEKEHRLAKAEKLASVGLMAAGVAHEINNPLAAVSVAAEALNLKGLSEEQKAVLSKSVLEASQRIQEIVSELLTLDSRQSLNQSAETVADVVRKGLHQINVPASIRVRFQIRDDLPKIWVDSHKMARAIGNIIKNGVQAMPDGGEMILSASVRDDGVLIRVSDTGCGMDSETAERVFDPFFSTREVGKGFGLGLAVAHRTIIQHGGEVKVFSEVGKGTVFEVLVPVASEEA